MDLKKREEGIYATETERYHRYRRREVLDA